MPNEQISGAKLILINPDGTEQPPITDFRKAVHKDNGTFKLVTGTADAPIETDYDIVQQTTDSMKPITTEFGILLAKVGTTDTISQLQKANIHLVRAQIWWSISPTNPKLDAYLAAGLDVQINFDYETTETPVPYQTDMTKVRAAYNAFATYYSKYKSQIKCVCIENEWDNSAYHSGTITDIQTQYLNILSTCVDENKKFGFPIADAGVTDGELKGWFDGHKDFSIFLNGIKNIPVTFANFHWYVPNIKTYDLKTVATKWMNACGKNSIITNEFGIRTADLSLWQKEVSSLKGFTPIAVAYSGINDPNKAITLTTDYLTALQ